MSNDLYKELLPLATNLLQGVFNPPNYKADYKSHDLEDLKSKVYAQPKFDIYETDNHFVVLVDAPGLNKNDITSTVKADLTLTVSYTRSRNDSNDNKEYARSANEIRYGKFLRVITLPNMVNVEDVSSSYSNGVIRFQFGKKFSKEIEVSMV